MDAAVIQRGLMELQPDLHFDAATKMGAWHPNQAMRQGVFYHGIHICAMDRGIVPEFKQWSVVRRLIPIGWEEADAEDASMQHRIIRPSDPDFLDAALACMNKTLGYQYRPDGCIAVYTPMAYRKVRGKVVQVGWRHTFERLIHADIPRLTRMAIAAKFEVDMLKFPVGAPHEIIAELVEE